MVKETKVAVPVEEEAEQEYEEGVETQSLDVESFAVKSAL